MLMGAPTPDSGGVGGGAREPNSSPWKNLALNFYRTCVINRARETPYHSVKYVGVNSSRVAKFEH